MTIEDVLQDKLHDACVDSDEVQENYRAMLSELSQLRAGHALLVRLGEALAKEKVALDRMRASQSRYPSDEKFAVHRAASDAAWGAKLARDAIDGHALSLVASPAQAVKP